MPCPARADPHRPSSCCPRPPLLPHPQRCITVRSKSRRDCQSTEIQSRALPSSPAPPISRSHPAPHRTHVRATLSAERKTDFMLWRSACAWPVPPVIGTVLLCLPLDRRVLVQSLVKRRDHKIIKTKQKTVRYARRPSAPKIQNTKCRKNLCRKQTKIK